MLSTESTKFYLLFGPRTVEWTFGYDLGSWDSFVLEVGNFITLSKTTSSQNLAFRILFNDYFTVGFGDFFLNDGLFNYRLFICLLVLFHSNIKYGVSYVNYRWELSQNQWFIVLNLFVRVMKWNLVKKTKLYYL